MVTSNKRISYIVRLRNSNAQCARLPFVRLPRIRIKDAAGGLNHIGSGQKWWRFFEWISWGRRCEQIILAGHLGPGACAGVRLNTQNVVLQSLLDGIEIYKVRFLSAIIACN